MNHIVFQLILSDIDEEIIYRGILMGLLMSSLRNKIPLLGNPNVLSVAILVGLIHALQIDKNYTISFDLIYLCQASFTGYVWGWVTIKSRGILLAILSHNFSNFLGTLAIMIK